MSLLTIVIPVYNEKDNIIQGLQSIRQDVQGEYKVLIVYDREDDNTLPVVRQHMPDLSMDIQLVKNKYGCGALNAIKTGLESADTKYVIVTMADLSDPPKVINNMLAVAEKKQADIVCGSRYMRDGKQLGGPVIKGLMSRFAGLTLHWFAGVPTHDATNSFKLYRKSYLETVVIESNGGFELGLELVVKAYLSKRVICEVPTTWTDRANGQSNFKILEWLPHYLKWYFQAYQGLFE